MIEEVTRGLGHLELSRLGRGLNNLMKSLTVHRSKNATLEQVFETKLNGD